MLLRKTPWIWKKLSQSWRTLSGQIDVNKKNHLILRFRNKNKEIDDLKEIIDELLNQQKDQQEVEKEKMSKSLHTERCNTDQLKNERNSLKVTSSPDLIVKFIFPYLDCYGAHGPEDAGTGAWK